MGLANARRSNSATIVVRFDEETMSATSQQPGPGSPTKPVAAPPTPGSLHDRAGTDPVGFSFRDEAVPWMTIRLASDSSQPPLAAS